MRVKSFLAPGAFLALIIAGVIVVSLASSEFVFVSSACACGTVNDEVIDILDELDAEVQKYATAHNGLFPTYSELVGLIADDRWFQPYLTPHVDVATGAFTFDPTRNDVHKIGYAVSLDQRQYILLGVGWTETYKRVYWFGQEVCRYLIGSEFPVLRPGDIPPKSSPPA